MHTCSYEVDKPACIHSTHIISQTAYEKVRSYTTSHDASARQAHAICLHTHSQIRTCMGAYTACPTSQYRQIMLNARVPTLMYTSISNTKTNKHLHACMHPSTHAYILTYFITRLPTCFVTHIRSYIHCIACHHSVLHYITLHSSTLHSSIAEHSTTQLSIECISSPYILLHYIARMNFIALLYMMLHQIAILLYLST